MTTKKTTFNDHEENNTVHEPRKTGNELEIKIKIGKKNSKENCG